MHINLNSWYLGDEIKFHPIGEPDQFPPIGPFVDPGEYIVLCKDILAFEDYYGTGIYAIEMNSWPRALVTTWEGPLYLSVDLDVIDPACVPGVSHHEPGGPSTRHVIHLIQELPVPIAWLTGQW